MPDHAQRFVEVIGRGVLIDLGGGAFLGADAPSVVAEVVCSQWDVGVQGFTHGLAVIPGFGDGEHFEVLLDTVGNLQQDQRARLHAGFAPGISGSMGGIQGFFDVCGVGAGEFGDGLAVYRGQVGEVLAVDRFDELAVDEIAITGLEGNDSAFAAGMGVTHDESPGLVIVWDCCDPA